MNIIDDLPIIVVIAALLVNIAIGVNNGIGFNALMVRCIVVTIVFGIFAHLIAKTFKNAVEYSSISTRGRDKSTVNTGQEETNNNNGNKSTLDIIVPPLDDAEFINMRDESSNEFVEVNPVYMGSYKQDEQD